MKKSSHFPPQNLHFQKIHVNIATVFATFLFEIQFLI